MPPAFWVGARACIRSAGAPAAGSEGASSRAGAAVSVAAGGGFVLHVGPVDVEAFAHHAVVVGVGGAAPDAQVAAQFRGVTPEQLGEGGGLVWRLAHGISLCITRK